MVSTPLTDTRDQLLEATLAHVPFDGWTEAAFQAAITDLGIDEGLARAVCPRGAFDLALACHAQGDGVMLAQLRDEDLTGMRFRDKVTTAVWYRLEAMPDKEVIRRATTLFALPQHAGDGARAVWGTCDAIWTALGDSSQDVNWYTKRATLSAVYSATLLYWLGDDSPGHQKTREFLDRRIDNVMQIEKIKAQVNANPALKPFLAAPNWLFGKIRAPGKTARTDLPGTVSPDTMTPGTTGPRR